jgi:single-stranded-DNA-specific exonuclease
VLGPAANKISEHFGRPAALVAFDGEVGRGSARAPRGSRLHELLAVCTEHLDAHGGHDGAAGFTVRRADFDRFKDAFLRAAENSLGAAGEVPAPETNVEAEVPAPELTAALADEVSRLGPFGEGNPEPLLATLATAMAGTARPMGSGRSLSFRIKTGHGSSRVVGLGFAHKIQEIEALGKSGRLDMAYRLSRDARSGEAELMLEDFRPSA